MIRCVQIGALLLAFTLATGCGDSTPTPVPTDPDNVKKLEELQKQGGKGEKR